MVHSTKRLEPILKLGNKIYLRKNIEQVEVTDEITEESHQEWQADEVWFEDTDVDLQHIHDNFDLYYDWAKEKRENKKIKRQKAKKVRELIEEQYNLADMKEMLDQLVIDNLN